MAVLVILLAGQAMATMDASILAVAAPSLRTDLGASGAELQLALAIYTLALAALIVTGARLGGILGYRRAFVASYTALLTVTAGLALGTAAGRRAPAPRGPSARVARGNVSCDRAVIREYRP